MTIAKGWCLEMGMDSKKIQEELQFLLEEESRVVSIYHLGTYTFYHLGIAYFFGNCYFVVTHNLL